MSKIEIRNRHGSPVETVVINDKPFWAWTKKEWDLWKGETKALLEYANHVKTKLIQYAISEGHLN